jgi:hypothetical protein
MSADLISKAEVARLLGGEGSPVSLSYVNQLLGRKKLPKVRLSYRVTRIPRQAVLDFIRSRTVDARATVPSKAEAT